MTYPLRARFDWALVDAVLLGHPAQRRRVERGLRTLTKAGTSVLFLCRNEDEWALAARAATSFGLSSFDRLRVPSLMPADVAKAAYGYLTGNGTYSNLCSRIDFGKCIIHLAMRSSPFISRFKPPKGAVCHAFHKVVWTNGCMYDCSYCYLQGNQRMAPHPKVFLNLEDLFRELERHANPAVPLRLNAGELGDPMSIDPAFGIVEQVLPLLESRPNLQLLLLTKSGHFAHLPNRLPPNVIAAASLTTCRNYDRLEHGTANPRERMAGLVAAKARGARVEVRIDPVVADREEWETEYEHLIRAVSTAVDPDCWTVGQPRFYPSLLSVAEKRFPQAGRIYRDMATERTGDGRRRASAPARREIYEKIASLVKRHSDSPFSLCKEESPVAHGILQRAHRNECICLPGKIKRCRGGAREAADEQPRLAR